ncbi:TPA: hypothetical protein U2K68_001569 [Providencia stuartii]|nr:hypothetical protein [Providencia stuartii]HEM7165925.1 hypothetical protein [Providencia stuartii]
MDRVDYQYDEFRRTIEKSCASEHWSYRYSGDHQLVEVLPPSSVSTALPSTI